MSAYKKRIALSNANLDTELRNFAKAVGHHGPKAFQERVRQRMNVAITPEYAKELCALAGWRE